MSDVAIPGWLFVVVPAVVALVAAGVKVISFVVKADDRYVRKSDFNPKSCPTREECSLRHNQVEAELERRASRTHDLANEMQKAQGLWARLDKRIAVIGTVIAAIAAKQGIVIPDEDQ